MGHVDVLRIMAYANELAKRTLIADIKSAKEYKDMHGTLKGLKFSEETSSRNLPLIYDDCALSESWRRSLSYISGMEYYPLVDYYKLVADKISAAGLMLCKDTAPRFVENVVYNKTMNRVEMWLKDDDSYNGETAIIIARGEWHMTDDNDN